MFFGRGKNKIQHPYTLKDMYNEYIVDKEGPYAVSYSDFVDICNEFYKGVSEYVLQGGLYKLPYNLGSLSVIKIKYNKDGSIPTSINWVETAKLGKRVIETNDHSNYSKFRFRWDKTTSHLVNITKYQIIFTRANKRKLAAIIKSGEYEYFDVENKN